MAKHEFGIMNTTPQLHELYESYEPEKYNCISVHDDFIEPLLKKLSVVDCYWHTLKCPQKNIAYFGITLIPPESMDLFLELLDGSVGLNELKSLMAKAKAENKFVIHFGI